MTDTPTNASVGEALRAFIYETTHLSPCRDDGSHDCRISAETLAKGRAAFAMSAAAAPPSVEGVEATSARSPAEPLHRIIPSSYLELKDVARSPVGWEDEVESILARQIELFDDVGIPVSESAQSFARQVAADLLQKMAGVEG